MRRRGSAAGAPATLGLAPLARYGVAILIGVAILLVPTIVYAVAADDGPTWVVPVNAPIWGGFRTPQNPNHQGVDLGAKRYVPIRAAASGVVVERECNASLNGQPYSCDTDGSPQVQGCGWYIDIHHDGGIDTRYCHMSFPPLVQLGDTVTVGQTVGYVGSSGNSSAPHLHFEVHQVGKGGSATNDNAIDPVPFMKEHGAPLGLGNDDPAQNPGPRPTATPTPTPTPTPTATHTGPPVPTGPAVDVDGDGKTNLVVWRPADAQWLTHTGDASVTVALGMTGDIPVVGDYDGDGKADLALWRPLDGRWIVHASSGKPFPSVLFGSADDIPMPADYDGDGRTDFAVYAPANGQWLIRYATGAEADPISIGQLGDLPVVGDFDGDGKADPAVWRPSDGSWIVHLSSGAKAPTVVMGGPGDIPVAGDFDGDGKDDFAVWSPAQGMWYVQYATGKRAEVPLGIRGDIPVIGDYDGDGIDDLAVWRPSDGRWLVQVSSGASGPEVVHGTTGDVPANSPVWLNPDGTPWTADQIRTRRLVLAAQRGTAIG